MSEHVLPPLLTEERVRDLRRCFAMYTGTDRDTIVALCDAWLARGVTEAEREAIALAINALATAAGRYDRDYAEMLDEASATLRALASRKPREGDTRQCTCHPDDNPPVPCPRKYALSECRQAALSPADVPSAELCGTCIDGKALAAHGRNSADFELALVVCPDCNGTGRVAASDAKETKEPTL